MDDHRARLRVLLRELFQFDCSDLDFGLYRIMNYKAGILGGCRRHARYAQDLRQATGGLTLPHAVDSSTADAAGAGSLR